MVGVSAEHALECSASAGLTEQEASARLERDGPNELGEKPPKSPILSLLGQFTDVTVHEPILNRAELLPMLAYGALMGALGLGVFLTLETRSLHLARTATFTVFALAPLFHAFNSRSSLR